MRNTNRTRSGSASRVFKLSRTKIEDFIRCPRCFYLDRKLGVSQPPGFPFNLNSAVDLLLKKEFDAHRARGTQHPLMTAYGIKAVPFHHPELDRWRENFFGIQYLHPETGYLITGAVDDLWVNPKGELHVVDYKATSKDGEVGIDAEWQGSYKRQMEIYQWLLRRNNFKVSDTGYFVYCNARRDRRAFDGKLEFKVKIIPYEGDASWVDQTIQRAHAVLKASVMPKSSADCAYCKYRKAASDVE